MNKIYAIHRNGTLINCSFIETVCRDKYMAEYQRQLLAQFLAKQEIEYDRKDWYEITDAERYNRTKAALSELDVVTYTPSKEV